MHTVSDLVSVVIPAYNQGPFIRSTLLSALTQSYSPFEVIVVNDGSTDDTHQQIEPFVDRITYVTQRNLGLSAARNTGIRRARGQWIALLDADDLWHADKIKTQLSAIGGKNDIGLIGSPSAATLPKDLPPAPVVRSLRVRDFLLSAPMGPSSALVRRSVFDSIGMFDESLQPAADRDMWLRIAARFNCVLVDSPCWWYRRHSGQMSRNPARMLDDYRRLLAKFFDANPEYKHLRSLAAGYMNFDAAVAYFDQGSRTEALRYLARSAWHQPLGLRDSKWPALSRSKFAGRIMLDRLLQLAPK